MLARERFFGCDMPHHHPAQLHRFARHRPPHPAPPAVLLPVGLRVVYSIPLQSRSELRALARSIDAVYPFDFKLTVGFLADDLAMGRLTLFRDGLPGLDLLVEKLCSFAAGDTCARSIPQMLTGGWPTTKNSLLLR